jgi:hypothetical protein
MCEEQERGMLIWPCSLMHQYLPFPPSVKSYVQQADCPAVFQNIPLSKDEATNSSNGGSPCLPTIQGLVKKVPGASPGV